MSGRLKISGEYPADWKEISDAAWATAGHRCIRCCHPYRKGEHGKGEWTACSTECTHKGPLAYLIGGKIVPIVSSAPAGELVKDGKNTLAQWRIGTTHHLDGNKANCAWWNLLALCQRCHLQVQGKVDPSLPYFLEHSDWFKPYAAGFYAAKYEGRQIDRAEAERRLEELLAYERLA